MFSSLAVPETIPVRRWTRVAAFTLQAGFLAAVLVIPLLYPQGLPQGLTMRHIFTPTSYQDVPVNTSPSSGHTTGLAHVQTLVVNQNHAFTFVRQDRDLGVNTPPALGDVVGTGTPSVPNSILSLNFQPMPSPPKAIHPIRTSAMMEGNLIHKVEPQYPIIAKQLRIQGTVIVKALISRTGAIEQAQVVSGPSLLGPAAVDAIRQWKYRPYILNGDPVEVETQITVNFVLH